MALLKKMLE
jgi:serine/threonine-protein kinase ULK4